MRLEVEGKNLWIEVPDMFPAKLYGRLPGEMQKLFIQESEEDKTTRIDVGTVSNGMFKAIVTGWNVTVDQLAITEAEKANVTTDNAYVLPIDDFALDNMDVFVKTSLVTVLVQHVTSKMQGVSANSPK